MMMYMINEYILFFFCINLLLTNVEVLYVGIMIWIRVQLKLPRIFLNLYSI